MEENVVSLLNILIRLYLVPIDTGIQAALAANMKCIAYLGGGQIAFMLLHTHMIEKDKGLSPLS